MTAAPGSMNRRRGIARGEPAYSRGCLPLPVCLMGERFRQLEALRGQSWSGCDPWQLEHMCANLHVSSLLHLPWLYLRHASWRGSDRWGGGRNAGGWPAQADGSGNQLTSGRFGFRGQRGAVWSSWRQYEQRAIARALPVKASLYSLGSVTDQLRSLLARAARLYCLS